MNVPGERIRHPVCNVPKDVCVRLVRRRDEIGRVLAEKERVVTADAEVRGKLRGWRRKREWGGRNWWVWQAGRSW